MLFGGVGRACLFWYIKWQVFREVSGGRSFRSLSIILNVADFECVPMLFFFLGGTAKLGETLSVVERVRCHEKKG